MNKIIKKEMKQTCEYRDQMDAVWTEIIDRCRDI
jgi:hypothetical protein